MGVTLEDVGRHCGVSRSTVSRVINDSPLVNQVTKERVLKAFPLAIENQNGSRAKFGCIVDRQSEATSSALHHKQGGWNPEKKNFPGR